MDFDKVFKAEEVHTHGAVRKRNDATIHKSVESESEPYVCATRGLSCAD